jgi:hypothetical protein
VRLNPIEIPARQVRLGRRLPKRGPDIKPSTAGGAPAYVYRPQADLFDLGQSRLMYINRESCL